MKRFQRITTMWALVGILLLIAAGPGKVLAQDNETCLACHSDPDLTGLDAHGNEVTMFVAEASVDSSVHAGFACVDCHQDLAGAEDFPHEESLQPVDCGLCHDDVTELFNASAHHTNNPNAPTCSSCHGTHNILSHQNPAAMSSAAQLPYTCSNCHSKQTLKDDPDIRIANSFDRYMRGIHARGIQNGIGSAASCNDCHGMHNLKKASDPESMVNKMNIPKTCSKCHNDVYIQYSRGIHGKALAQGILDSPNCADCHGEHEILEINKPGSPVNRSNLADYVCAKCHHDPQIVEKYGLGDQQFTSYQDSYHGLAVRGGSVKAATCVSCHEAHDILPKSNPASSINPANITATCQQCHPKANATFAQSYTHQAYAAGHNKIDATVRTIYIVLIVLVIGGMLAHNLIILGRFVVDKHRRQKGQPTVQRFTGAMVYQHMVVTIAFMTLVITGFALRYPDAWWVSVLNFFWMDEAARSTIHRIAAVLLIYISIHHGLYLFMTRKGKKELKALMPVKEDVGQIGENLAYHLGKAKEKPRFGRFDYTEKAEYWALVWGTIVMAMTGFILWFPTFWTGFLPSWVVKVAETIHLYEAWLATLAIVVFHFFFVIFHPEQYPMSFTWLTGRMTVAECKEHHAGWYDSKDPECQKLQKEVSDQTTTPSTPS